MTVTRSVMLFVLALAPAVSGQSAPADLKPFPAASQSEMRLVVQRYSGDRIALSRTYAGPARAGLRGAERTIQVSAGRIARLKRFDLNWQTALVLLPAARLSETARRDLEVLKTTVNVNLAQAELDVEDFSRPLPALPFEAKLVQLIEDRIRLHEVSNERALGVLNDVSKEIGELRERLTAGVVGKRDDRALRIDKDVANAAADAAVAIRSSLADWFHFYSDADPPSSASVGAPYRTLDGTLDEYSRFLRDTVAAADLTTGTVTPSLQTILPAPNPRDPDVPDLLEIIARGGAA